MRSYRWSCNAATANNSRKQLWDVYDHHEVRTVTEESVRCIITIDITLLVEIANNSYIQVIYLYDGDPQLR